MKVTIPLNDFNRIVKTAKGFVAKGGGFNKPEIAQVYVEWRTGMLRATAIDGYKGVEMLCEYVRGESDMEGAFWMPVFKAIPPKSVPIENPVVTIAKEGHTVTVSTPFSSQAEQGLDGIPVALAKFLPGQREEPIASVLVDRKLMSQALSSLEDVDKVRIDIYSPVQPIVLRDKRTRACVLPVREVK